MKKYEEIVMEEVKNTNTNSIPASSNSCVKCGITVKKSFFCPSCGTAVLHNILVKTATTANFDPRGPKYTPWKEPVSLPPRLLRPSLNDTNKFRITEPFVPVGKITKSLLKGGKKKKKKSKNDEEKDASDLIINEDSVQSTVAPPEGWGSSSGLTREEKKRLKDLGVHFFLGVPWQRSGYESPPPPPNDSDDDSIIKPIPESIVEENIFPVSIFNATWMKPLDYIYVSIFERAWKLGEEGLPVTQRFVRINVNLASENVKEANKMDSMVKDMQKQQESLEGLTVKGIDDQLLDSEEVIAQLVQESSNRILNYADEEDEEENEIENIHEFEHLELIPDKVANLMVPLEIGYVATDVVKAEEYYIYQHLEKVYSRIAARVRQSLHTNSPRTKIDQIWRYCCCQSDPDAPMRVVYMSATKSELKHARLGTVRPIARIFIDKTAVSITCRIRIGNYFENRTVLCQIDVTPSWTDPITEIPKELLREDARPYLRNYLEPRITGISLTVIPLYMESNPTDDTDTGLSHDSEENEENSKGDSKIDPSTDATPSTSISDKTMFSPRKATVGILPKILIFYADAIQTLTEMDVDLAFVEGHSDVCKLVRELCTLIRLDEPEDIQGIRLPLSYANQPIIRVGGTFAADDYDKQVVRQRYPLSKDEQFLHAVEISRIIRGNLGRERAKRLRVEQIARRQFRATRRIQTQYRMYVARMRYISMLIRIEFERNFKNASIIQKYARGFIYRRRSKKFKSELSRKRRHTVDLPAFFGRARVVVQGEYQPVGKVRDDWSRQWRLLLGVRRLMYTLDDGTEDEEEVPGIRSKPLALNESELQEMCVLCSDMGEEVKTASDAVTVTVKSLISRDVQTRLFKVLPDVMDVNIIGWTPPGGIGESIMEGVGSERVMSASRSTRGRSRGSSRGSSRSKKNLGTTDSRTISPSRSPDGRGNIIGSRSRSRTRGSPKKGKAGTSVSPDRSVAESVATVDSEESNISTATVSSTTKPKGKKSRKGRKIGKKKSKRNIANSHGTASDNEVDKPTVILKYRTVAVL